MEIKEYLDFINLMIPNDQIHLNQNNTLTFLSANFENEEHSLLTIPSEMSSLLNMNSLVQSKKQRQDKGEILQVVKEQEKELSGWMLDGLDEKELQNSSADDDKVSKSHQSESGQEESLGDKGTEDPRLDKIIPSLHRKSLSMDILAQARLRYRQKKKLDRAGSAGLDLRSLKLFVEHGEASDSSDQKNHRH